MAVLAISRADLAAIALTSARITELEHLASYNWLERPSPTISVPGSPPLWSPPAAATRLAQDSGEVYIDQNAARNPRSPLEPLFRALYVEKPAFDISEVDIVTDRNNLRKLLRFVQATADKPFQIRVEIVGGKTALFTRVEKETTEIIRSFRGFGHNFEKAYTRPQTEGTGHHRIVSYDFGGLKCVVRHETDGYVGQKRSGPRSSEPHDALSDALRSDPETVVVKAAGKTVDQSSTLEIKTRVSHRPLDMAEVYPQLWLSQTPQLVVGYHRHARFDDVQLRDMSEGIAQWETANQTDLCKLGGLLGKIIEVVKTGSGRRAVVSYDGGVTLKVVTGEGKAALPDDLYAKWEAQDTQATREGKGETAVKEEAEKETERKAEA